MSTLFTVAMFLFGFVCLYLAHRQVQTMAASMERQIREHGERLEKLARSTLESGRVIVPVETQPAVSPEQAKEDHLEAFKARKAHLTTLNDLAYGITEKPDGRFDS